MTASSLSRRDLMAALAALPLAGALAGCASSNPQVFTLAVQPGAPAAVASPTGVPAAIAVATAGIPKYLDRPQIVRRGGSYQLDVSEFDRWGEPFADMVTRVLIGDLALRLPDSQVFRDGSATATGATATVQLDLSRFDGEADGTVILAARWTVTRVGAAIPETARISARPAGDSTADLVAAMSQALGQLADKIAVSLAR
jgi:uncharacterized protein